MAMNPKPPAGGSDKEVRHAAAARGDPAALAAWYRAEHPQVYRLCLGFLADPAEADDVAQDAMLKLSRKIASQRNAGSYAAWRRSVVLNLCRDRLRRRKARRRAEERAADTRREVALPDPGEQVQQVELREQLASAFARLPEREREVLVLKDLEGQDTREVAALLGIREGSVRALLALARRRMRAMLGPQVTGGHGREPGHA